MVQVSPNNLIQDATNKVKESLVDCSMDWHQSLGEWVPWPEHENYMYSFSVSIENISLLLKLWF